MSDHRENLPERRTRFVHGVFVGALLLVVLTVIGAYLLGDFRGLNPGADFGLILTITLGIGICAGLVVAALHLGPPKDH